MKTYCKLKWTLCVLAFAALSCATPKDISYVRDLEYNLVEQASPAPDLKMQVHDILNITIHSRNKELAEPFNTVSGTTGSAPSTEYLIDSKGDIDFPILGTLHVEGLTTRQIRDLIADRIEQDGFIQNPVVKVSLKNFQVTVIGRTNNRVINVENGSLNLLQAIAQSGELGGRSKFRDVMVIRTQDGKREAYKVDLQSKSLFDSPAYHLQQNDIVYVKPRGSQLSPEGSTTLTFVNMGLSITSIIINYVIWGLRR